MRCFYCQNLNHEYAELDKTEKSHLFKVLRARAGTKLLLMNGYGIIAEGLVESEQSIKILSREYYSAPSKKIHLFAAVPRKNKMETMLSQCTELGVWSINPIFTDRSVAVPGKKNTVEKWKEKVIEACKQSHNPFIPVILSPVKLTESMKYVCDKGMKSYYGDRESGCMPDEGNLKENIALFVGPEGGFSENEISLMKKADFRPVSLPGWILKVETAAAVGTALLKR
ncbi:MAG: 16S rRNA (uracil(1498)-N(3))-methyltransferase [Victivallales bacterium]|nr:16S rRNA (uracil(1498)-N(3))-methyltransferase [Victivallales bacterium]